MLLSFFMTVSACQRERQDSSLRYIFNNAFLALWRGGKTKQLNAESCLWTVGGRPSTWSTRREPVQDRKDPSWFQTQDHIVLSHQCCIKINKNGQIHMWNAELLWRLTPHFDLPWILLHHHPVHTTVSQTAAGQKALPAFSVKSNFWWRPWDLVASLEGGKLSRL